MNVLATVVNTGGKNAVLQELVLTNALTDGRLTRDVKMWTSVLLNVVLKRFSSLPCNNVWVNVLLDGLRLRSMMSQSVSMLVPGKNTGGQKEVLTELVFVNALTDGSVILDVKVSKSALLCVILLMRRTFGPQWRVSVSVNAVMAGLLKKLMVAYNVLKLVRKENPGGKIAMAMVKALVFANVLKVGNL